MAHPYRTDESPARDRGPDIVFAGVAIVIDRSTRSIDYVFTGGRCHVLLGNDSMSWELLHLAAGRKAPESGTVTVGGKPASAALGSLHVPIWGSRRPVWERLIPWLKKPNFVRLERALTRGEVCAVDSPHYEVDPKAGDWHRVCRAIRAALARGATVLVRTGEWREAIDIGDVFHVFSKEGHPIGHGDIETIFRPDHKHPAAPDAIFNQEQSPACVVNFNGVRVALRPVRSDMSVSGIGADGQRIGFITHRYQSAFHVPARHVVANPTFQHGAESGSPPLPVYPDPPAASHTVGEPFVRATDLDLTSRYVVLDGEFGERYDVGAYQRVVLQAGHNHRFQVDLAKGVEATAGGRLRFGFDTAHIASN